MIDFIFGLIYFAIALSIIVFVHELGHLLVAKKFRVHCHEFSIGMGPKLKHLFTDKTGTEYVIRAIPIGGYVMLAGEEASESDSELEPDQLLCNKKPYQKILILVAGAFMNFILAFVLMFGVYFFTGYEVQSESNQVTVIKSSDGTRYPADIAGIQTGDEIVSVNGVATDDYSGLMSELGKEVDEYKITYVSAETGEENTVELEKMPILCNKEGIGVIPYYQMQKHDLIGSIKESIDYNFEIVGMSLLSLKLLFTGGAQVSDLTGPVGIATNSSYVVEAGFSTMIVFIAFLSVSIGFVNLMPFPALDGGRILVAFIELITRRKVPEKIENFVNNIGITLLLILMLFVTFADIYRLSYDDDIKINIRSEEESSCFAPSEEYKLNLSIDVTEDIKPDQTYVFKVAINSGIIESFDGKEINNEEYTMQITGEELLNGDLVNKELIVIPTSNSSDLIEVKVDIKNSLGLSRSTG